MTNLSITKHIELIEFIRFDDYHTQGCLKLKIYTEMITWVACYDKLYRHI